MEESRLWVVDDHAVLSGAMADSLRSYGFQDVHVADPRDLAAESLIPVAERIRPDIVLLDLFLGDDRLGLPLIEPLTELGAAVVVLSASHDEVLLAGCVAAGAVGILDKAMRFDELVECLRRVSRGETLIDEERRSHLLREAEVSRRAEKERMAPFRRLTASEQQILAMLLEGRAPKQIARARSVSLATVRNQIRAVLEKLEVSSERQALAMAREAGWSPSE